MKKLLARCRLQASRKTRVTRSWTLRRRIFNKLHLWLIEPPVMRAVVQRVSEASVAIGDQVKAAIRTGLLVLLGIEEADTAEDIEWLSGKLVRLRIFNDEQGVMNRSVQEVGGGILLISQFTLFASTKKGNRPSYSRSARPEITVPRYEEFVRRLSQDLGRPVQTGEFGAHMLVS